MKYGEIVELGRHRLMCGDATKREDVEALVAGERVDLVLTDPPYGMKCQDKNGVIALKDNRPIMGARDERFRNTLLSSNSYPVMIGDNSQVSARAHYEIARDLTRNMIFWGGQYFAHFLPISGSWIFWDKLTGTNDFSDGELAWCSFGKRIRKYTQMWNGVFMKCDYRLNGRGWHKGAKARIHPTQKPVELHMHILEDFSPEGATILDCFAGSGTTLIACEVTGRRCLTMELSPDYCDLIVNRYNKLTEGVIPFAE